MGRRAEQQVGNLAIAGTMLRAADNDVNIQIPLLVWVTQSDLHKSIE